MPICHWYLRAARGVLASAAWALLAAVPASAFSLLPVARTGEAAPGGGQFDRFGNETQPIVAPVNGRGEVAFFATLTRGGSDEGLFLRQGTRIVAVAREGLVVPGAGRISGFGRHPVPALSDAGTVAFAATVTGTRATEGVFAWSRGRVRPVAVSGTAAPGMSPAIFQGLDAPAINARGDVAFLATLRRGRESLDAIFVRRADGAVRKVVAQGDPAPAGGAFLAFGPPAVNARGVIAFAAAVEGKAVPGGIFVADGERVRMLLGAGEETPIGGIYAKLSERIGFDDRGAVAFHGQLKFAPVAAAIFAVSDDGRARAVAQLGEAAPDGGTFSHFGLWPAMTATGEIVFAASIDDGPSPIAIVLSRAAGLVRVAAVGDALPGGARIASLALYPVVSASASGGVTFAVAPTATGEGPEGLYRAAP
jgi:hypothetical protein